VRADPERLANARELLAELREEVPSGGDLRRAAPAGMAAAVVVDAGPLLMLARHERVAVEWLAEAIERETALLCAGATYAEVWRGHSQGSAAGLQAIRLSRALAPMTPVPTYDTIGRLRAERIPARSHAQSSSAHARHPPRPVTG
jgi:hypothetical protein